MRSLIFFLCCFCFPPNLLVANSNPVNRLTIKEKTFTSRSGIEVEAEVGAFEVPENRNNPNSATISLEFVKLKSTNPNPQEPLFYLEGGPGSSCTWQAENGYYLDGWIPYLELGDVVLVDQRGTGKGSDRTLYIWKKGLPKDVLVNRENAEKHSKAINEKALAAYEKRGVDLEGYTSVENANDFNELRQALGYDKISIMGFSYGTHLGQTYIKYHEETVENAVLIGVEGLNHTYKLPSVMDTHFRRLALLSNADENVNKDVPDLLALYERVIQKLEKNPIEVKVKNPLQLPIKVEIGAFGLNMLMRFDIGDASDLPIFPRLLYTIDQGDYSILTWFVQKRIRNFYGTSGMAATMDAASGATASRLQQIKAEEKTSYFDSYILNFGMGEDWKKVDLGDEFRQPLITNVRTLFMSGTLDFNTPPHQAEEVRWGFSNSSHIIVNNAGHEQTLRHPKANPTIIRFLKGENVDDVALSNPKLQFIPVKGETGGLWHPALGEQ
ncbi:MAG: alpha/beta hydrolase [Bacteroidota bacterium]